MATSCCLQKLSERSCANRPELCRPSSASLTGSRPCPGRPFADNMVSGFRCGSRRALSATNSDGAIWDAKADRAVAIYKSKAWGSVREHLTAYGLCWAWDDENEEPWQWHLFEIGAPTVVAFESGQAGGCIFDPARRRYAGSPQKGDKEVLRVGSRGDTVRYLQGVCRHEVARFVAWFAAHAPPAPA